MTADTHFILPPTLHDAKNRPYLAIAYHEAANRALVQQARLATAAKAARLGTASDKDEIACKHDSSAKDASLDAETFFQSAKRLEAEINQDRTLYQKMKQPVTKALIATAVLAEIISIPILVANCAVVSKHHKRQEKSGVSQLGMP